MDKKYLTRTWTRDLPKGRRWAMRFGAQLSWDRMSKAGRRAPVLVITRKAEEQAVWKVSTT
jgi:hypothetical protein